MLKYATGAEWKIATAGFEWETSTGGITVNSTTPITGGSEIRANAAATTPSFTHTYMATAVATDRFFTFNLKIVSAPAGTITIALFRDNVNGNGPMIQLNSNNTLRLFDAQGPIQRGSDSSALTTGTVYQVGLRYNRAAGTCEGTINGVAFASGATGVTMDMNVIRLGVIDSGTCDLRFDNVIVNDSSGSVNNTYAPVGSKVAILLPTAAGDNAATTGVYSYINELPPTDTATSGSTMIELDNNGDIADYNVTDSSTAGIGSSDIISGVFVLARVREEAAGTSSYQLRIKSASGGTVTSTSSVDAGNTTPRTNPNGTTAFGLPLVSETDPTTGVAWTATGTNSIDNAQIGVANTDADSTPDLWVLAMAAMVVYYPSASGKIKVYNGSSFVAKPVKVWNGSAWVTKPVKRWNGSSWVTTTY